MSLAGFRKQLSKANQYVNEKIGGAKGTELDDEYVQIEKRIDIIGKLIEEVIARTHEFLQPNPACRARLMTVNTLHKLQGKSKNCLYPQPEGQLGECMVKYGKELGEESLFGESLLVSGEAFKQLAEIKYTLEDQVKQNFLEPMHGIQTRELKEISHHRKKLEGRRLDFDCKKRRQDKGSKIGEEEIKSAEEKFAESKVLTESAMANFLSSEVEHIQALTEFIAAESEYHRQAMDIMENLHRQLSEKQNVASSKPRPEHIPKRVASSRSLRELDDAAEVGVTPGAEESGTKNGPFGNQLGVAGSERRAPSPGPTAIRATTASAADKDSNQASARALFDFDAENPTELPFKQGDTIHLIQQLDDNWYEGECHGRQGYFPVNYVDVIVPLK